MQLQKPLRPLGVTILAILDILVGIFGLLAGVAVIGLSVLIDTSALLGTGGGILTGLGLIIGGVIVVFSLIWLAVGFGFLNGKGWAWSLGMVFSVLSILGAIAFTALGSYGSIVGVVLWGVMIYYLTRTRVKSFFGKGPGILPSVYPTAPAFPASSPPTFTSPMAATPTGITTSFGSTNAPTSRSTTPSAASRFCINCGAAIPPGMAKCGSCGQTLQA